MSRFSEIEAFVAVVEAGSFSGAARRLDVAVSAISRRISELETRLGTRLANRSTRGFAPTAAGQLYYERCVRLLNDLEEADAEVTGEQAAVTGIIRIAAPLSFGVKHLSAVLNAYACERPQLRFDIDLSDRRVDIVEEGFDFAIRIGSLADSSLVAKRLFDVRHVVAASPAFWDQHGRPERPEDLQAMPALLYGSRMNPVWQAYRDPQGRSGQVRLIPRWSVSNGEFSTAAAIEGLGFVLEPTFICADSVSTGELEVVLPDIHWFDMKAYVIWPSGKPLPLRVRNLIDHLSEAFQAPLAWDVVCESSCILS